MTNFKKSGFGVAVIATAFILQGCEPSVPEYFQQVDVVAAQTSSATSTRSCNANTLQWMVGQPEGVIAGVELAGPVRVIGVNQAITMEHNPARTNFYLDVAGRITRVTCG